MVQSCGSVALRDELSVKKRATVLLDELHCFLSSSSLHFPRCLHDPWVNFN